MREECFELDSIQHHRRKQHEYPENTCIVFVRVKLEAFFSAIETPGGKRIIVKNIIAQQITRKRGIFKKTFGI
jgi:hypothetical protein